VPSPSEILGERIVERLVAEGLLTSDQKGRVFPKLAAGSMKPEDWRLAVEMSDIKDETDDE
jgi:hypothetical protein